MEPFDPYQQWLGIPDQMRPLNHYILLGIRLFESDSELINQAFDMRMSVLKRFQSGPRAELSELLKTKVALAKQELVDPEKKLAYDKSLKKRLAKIQEKQNSRITGEKSEQGFIVSKVKTPTARAVDPASVEHEFESDKNAIAQAAIGRPVGVSQSQASGESEQDVQRDDDTLVSYLTDFRVLVAVVTVTFVVMILTVKLLSLPSRESAKVIPNTSTDPSSDTTTNQSNSHGEEADGVVKSEYSIVKQNAEASFEIPLQKATLKGKAIKYGSQGISGWGKADEAIWSLTSDDRRSGFFYCKIIYQAKIECSFSVQLGNRPPRRFTIYPHDEDFEEEFIVKLDRAETQTLRVTAGELDFSPGVEIKRIHLVPTR